MKFYSKLGFKELTLCRGKAAGARKRTHVRSLGLNPREEESQIEKAAREEYGATGRSRPEGVPLHPFGQIIASELQKTDRVSANSEVRL